MPAVGAAIAAVTGRTVDEDPGAFHYRGIDLRHAAECALWTRLVNNASLRDPGGAPNVGSSLEAAVAREVLGGADVGVPRVPSRMRRMAGAALASVRGSTPIEIPSEAADVWFLVDHPKFLRFIAPLEAALAPKRAG